MDAPIRTGVKVHLAHDVLSNGVDFIGEEGGKGCAVCLGFHGNRSQCAWSG